MTSFSSDGFRKSSKEYPGYLEEAYLSSSDIDLIEALPMTVLSDQSDQYASMLCYSSAKYIRSLGYLPPEGRAVFLQSQLTKEVIDLNQLHLLPLL